MAHLKKLFFDPKDILVFWFLIQAFSRIKFTPEYFQHFTLDFAFPESKAEVDGARLMVLWSRFNHVKVSSYSITESNKSFKRLIKAAGQKTKLWNLMKKKDASSEMDLMKNISRQHVTEMLFATLTLIQLDLAGATNVVADILKSLNWEQFARVMILSNDHFVYYLIEYKAFQTRIFIQNSNLLTHIRINFCLSSNAFFDQFKIINPFVGRLVRVHLQIPRW